MILKEQNNQEKILMDGVLDGNHEQENMPVPMERQVLSLSVWFSSYHPVCMGLLGPLTNAPCRSEWL